VRYLDSETQIIPRLVTKAVMKVADEAVFAVVRLVLEMGRFEIGVGATR
jgi:hypothetical protein